MNIRRLKNAFKEEIYKDDLKKVLLNGFVTMILCTVLVSLVNIFLLFVFHVKVSILLFALGFALSYKIKKSYFTYHIVYPIISVVFLMIGLYLYNSVTAFAYNPNFSLYYIGEAFKIGFINTLNIFNPVYYVSNFSMFNIINLIIVVATICFTYKMSKNIYY